MLAHILMDFAEDDRLLAVSAATDAQAQERLAMRLATRTKKLCLALLRNRFDAEDASQQAWLEVIRAAPSFRGECRLESWSDRITARICIRMAQERRLSSVRNESDAALEFEVDQRPPDVSWEELPQSIRHYVNQLPEVKRTALLLRHVMDYSIDEIAEHTAVSVNTVKDRLLSAREHLRKLIRQDEARSEAKNLAQRGLT
jgi:RNA polymerase sigma factor (sigma-70 family)